jgi:hypothetical protein
MMALLRAHLRHGGRLVILDRAPRSSGNPSRGDAAPHHELAPAIVEADIRDVGLTVLSRDDRFIDRSGDDDVWWLLVATNP